MRHPDLAMYPVQAESKSCVEADLVHLQCEQLG